MNRISIISANGQIRIEADLPQETVDQPVFQFETTDYQIEATQTGDAIYVSNALNGYGQNCREDFKDALIEIYV